MGGLNSKKKKKKKGAREKICKSVARSTIIWTRALALVLVIMVITALVLWMRMAEITLDSF